MADSSGEQLPRASLQLFRDSRQLFADEYDRELAGVEGTLGALGGMLSRDSLLTAPSALDLDELLEAVQQELAERAECKRTGKAYKPRLFIPKKRRELEALDEELKARGATLSGTDFISQFVRLINKYKLRQPTIEVHYNDLTVETDALVGSAGIPTVWNSFVQGVQKLVGLKPPTTKHTILKGIKGVLAPGRTTLLLSPPGSGKSTLLKVLAGRYRDSASLRVAGSVTYNGHTFDEFNVNRTSAFISQHDNHTPNMTVLETLMFAYVCQQGFGKPDFDTLEALRDVIEKARAASRTAHAAPGGVGISVASAGGAAAAPARAGSVADPNDPFASCTGADCDVLEDEILALGERVMLSGVKVMSMMRAFGIAHTKDTPVGDSMLRGVSGGERKRVTCLEMLVGPRRVSFMDEISTGLDSATLYSIVDLVGKHTRGFNTTVLVSLLQPPPEVFFLFDDLLLLVEGHVLYHGPPKDAVKFFESLGFMCPARKDVPSFLLEAATPSGQLQYATDALLAARGIDRKADPGHLPHGGYVMKLAEMAEHFWSENVHGKAMSARLAAGYDKANSHPAALVHTPYALTPFQSLLVVGRRQFKQVTKDTVLIKGRLIQVLVIGLLLGGLFYKMPKTVAGGREFFGALFLSVMFTAMGQMTQLATSMASKPVWYKFRDNKFYASWVHSVASAASQLPLTVIDSAAWALVTYFMWGLSTSGAGYFFTHWLILIATSTCCGALFRLIAHLAPDGVAANSFGGVTLLVLIVMSGFTIPRAQIPPWWIWAYYISPFAWSLRAVVVNEFTSPDWDQASPLGTGNTVGVDTLSTFDFFTDRRWIWGGIGVLFGQALIFTMLSAVALARLSPAHVARIADAAAVEEARKEAAARRARMAAAGEGGSSKAGGAQGGKGGAAVVDVRTSIPFTPVTLVFRDLRYFVPNPAGGAGGKGADAPPARLELLKGITGYAEPGQLTALMGGSGAGKTTLMDCIAGRKTVGEITGDILVNGHPKRQATWSRVVGYCEQMDIHTPATTVLEALMFSARLRLPADVGADAVRGYCEEVMDVVDLTPQMYDLVGHPGSGLNVESRKRLTIAVELVANPSVVFMDEPTSGLDARAAAIVMRAVRNVARSGRAVLVTIHQPSIEIFEAFDFLLLLQRGGRTTYFGPLGTESSALIAYLTAVPGCPQIRPGYNPATWMLEVTGGAVAVGTQAVDADWPELYKASAQCKTNAARADELATRDAAALPELEVGGGTYAASFHTQAKALLRKYLLAYWRTPSYNLTRYVVTVLVAILYGTIFFKAAKYSNPATSAEVQSVMGVIYSSTSFLGMTNMMAAMPIVGLERVIYYREQGAATYNPWAFGVVMSQVEVPFLVSQSIIFVCIMYPLVGYVSSAAKFFYYLLLTIQSIMFYTTFGMFLTFITPSQQLGQVVGAGLNFLFNIFNGFVITYPNMGRGWRWINRASPTTWLLYGLAADQLGGDTATALKAPGYADVKTVADFLNTVFGYEYDFRFWCILIMFAYIGFLRVCGILALRYMNFLKR